MKRSDKKAKVAEKKRRAKEARRERQAAEAQAELVADPVALQEHMLSAHRDEESVDLIDKADEAQGVLDSAKRDYTEVRRSSASRQEKPSEETGMSAERARAMLERAAEACDEVIGMTRQALAGVSEERKAAAQAVLNTPQVRGVSDDGRKLPRRAPDPIVTLMKIQLQAASLIKRIIGKTHPDLARQLKKAA